MRSNIANVLDLELTCYEGGAFPEGERAEVIEVGLTMVDLTSLAVIKTLSIPVVPVFSRVSPYCTELTGWTEAKLKRQGVPFAEACRRLCEKYGAVNRLLVVDTDDETDIVKSECALLGVSYPFGESMLNVSTLFALLTGQKSNLGLDRMLDALGLAFQGKRHRGADDSLNIAYLLVALLKRSRFQL